MKQPQNFPSPTMHVFLSNTQFKRTRNPAAMAATFGFLQQLKQHNDTTMVPARKWCVLTFIRLTRLATSVVAGKPAT